MSTGQPEHTTGEDAAQKRCSNSAGSAQASSLTGCALTANRKTSKRRFDWSGGSWWACQDLNLGPHPYQQNEGNRCANRRFRRSRSTVAGEVMCSHRVQLCALIAPAALPSTSVVLAVVVRVSVVVGTLTGPPGRPSAARLAVVPTAAGAGAHLPPAVGQREANLRRERRVVAAEVGEEGVPARPCHGACDPPLSYRPCTHRRPSARLPRQDHQPDPAEAGTPGAATPSVTTAVTGPAPQA
jgi:hypothetical protein